MQLACGSGNLVLGKFRRRSGLALRRLADRFCQRDVTHSVLEVCQQRHVDVD